MDGSDEQRNKGHKTRNVGAKAKKQVDVRKRKAGLDVEPNRGKNPKAFTGNSAGSYKVKAAAQSMEKREHTLHVPVMDNTLASVLEEPPLLVAVVGPPGCGKTTLIRSIVKFYSNRNLQKVRGPVTVIAGRSRRLTFLECPNNLHAMCDIVKTADLILLVVDGAFGFEMETFEFLNIAQVHGFPRIIGIVSHLDTLKDTKALKKRKKFLRHRFWHEVADGAKMICLAPMHHNMYRGTDVLKLHQLLICVNTKMQHWRNTHSCILVDRHEDITDPDIISQEPNHNRTIAMFGYVRGKPLKPGQAVHIPGLGDFPVKYVSHQDDPCSFNDIRRGTSQGHKMRHLNAKQKRLYAPYCDVGGVVYDEDAIYIHEDAERQQVERTGEGVQLMRDLQRVKVAVDERNEAAELSIFSASQRRPVNFTNDESLELDMHDSDVERPVDYKENGYNYDDDEEDNTDDEATWDRLATEAINEGDDDNALDSYGDMPEAVPVSSKSDSKDVTNSYSGLLLEYELAPRLPDDLDSVRIKDVHHDWEDEDLLARVKNLFVTGVWTVAEGDLRRGNDHENKDDVANRALEEKGYDSEDEEFQQIIRGEKSIVDKRGNRNDDDDGDQIMNNKRTTSSQHDYGPQKLNALADISSSNASKYSANNRNKNKGDDDDDYDILAENNDGGEEKGANSGFSFADAELVGLVDHFVGRDIDRHGVNLIEDTTDGSATNRFGGTKGTFHGADEEEADMAGIAPGSELTPEQAELMKKRMTKKKAFDDGYDTGVDGTTKNATTGYYRHLLDVKAQKEKDLEEALKIVGEDLDKKIALVGYFSGLYVRVVLENIPVEFVHVFDPCTPLVIGGLNSGEDQLQMVQARVKRHRWYPRILKAQDPLLISMGWRRFQTQPIFAAEDPNGRLRYLKYTPLHMHCYMSFYGPVTPQNTGFIAIPVQNRSTPGFRLTCTGYTIGNDETTQIVKKLKLTGTPEKVCKTVCFVKGMFNSDIEAAKFVGAKVKAVSGLRGIIKAVIKGKAGLVRCTFEDKVLMSDIVFLRAWKPVDPPRYCAMAPTLLDPNWVGMRTMAQLRRDMNLKANKKDSEYTEVKKRRNANLDEPAPILLSRSMRKDLPFNLKEEYISLDSGNSEEKRRVMAATTVAPSIREMKQRALLDSFRDRADKMDKLKNEAKTRQRAKTERQKENDEVKYKESLKKAKKETARKEEFRSQHKSRK